MFDGETADDLLAPSRMKVHRLAVLLGQATPPVRFGHQSGQFFLGHPDPIPPEIDSADFKSRPRCRRVAPV